MIKKSFAFLLGLSCAHLATANPEAEKVYLTQIVNQLDALQPLIIAASGAQSPDQRVTFHYQQYCDKQGRVHNGLLEDVQAVKAGVVEHLNAPAIEPRSIKPLQGDYLNLKPVPTNGILAPNNPNKNFTNASLLSPTSLTNPSEIAHADS